MLEVRHLSVNYRSVQALEDVCLTLASGELVGIMGPNGAGKSTLLKALLGLIPVSQGQVFYQGLPLKHQRQKVAYVPQRSQLDWDYPVSVWHVVMMARTVHTGWLRSPSRQSREIVREALQRVEMLGLRRRQIGELSGGQQQRVFLARAIAQQAELFLFDEPFTAIDKKTETVVLEIYAELKAQGKTLLVSSHSWGSALSRYDRLLLLNQRLIASGLPSQVMTPENVQQAYGTGLQPQQFDQTPEPMYFC